MKKIALFAMLLLAALTASAQQRIKVEFDYSQGSYKGMTEEMIAQVEEDWLKDRPRLENRFVEGFLDRLSPSVAVVGSKDVDVVYTIIIRSVDKKGNMVCEIPYTAEDGSEKVLTIRSCGGVFGSFLNLFGDGMEDLGELFARWLNSSALIAK